MMKRLMVVALSFLFGAQVWATDYNVRQPSLEMRPRWTGAKPGEWTMDLEAAHAKAKEANKCMIVLVTGSWWCPHCEAFEEKVVLSPDWRDFISDRGYYLGMVDFPYRGEVEPAQEHKSLYPEFGTGWGFKCWLYDEAFLSANGLTREQGFAEIEKMYAKQDALGTATSSTVTIKSWDGNRDIIYRRVGYPTLIVYLPDGTEAGRFSPSSTDKGLAEARQYVFEKIDAIIDEALGSKCGLCTDDSPVGILGEQADLFNGWVTNPEGHLNGLVEIKTGRKSRTNRMRLSATVTYGGRKTSFSASVQVPEAGLGSVVMNHASDSLALTFHADGFTGVYRAEGVEVPVTGARNIFKAKDPTSVQRAAEMPLGTWGMAIRVLEGECCPDLGFGALSVSVVKGGRCKVYGKLGDGTRVSVRSQILAGADDVFCLPFVAPLYSAKRGGIACNLWFKDGWLFNVTDISPWRVLGNQNFTAAWRPIYSARPGSTATADEKEVVFGSIPSSIHGRLVLEDPTGSSVAVYGRKWTGDDLSSLVATYDAKSLLLNGRLRFSVLGATRRQSSAGAKVFGVVIDGAAYCSALVSGEGCWPFKISSCDACED